jgi:hypothetical protein
METPKLANEQQLKISHGKGTKRNPSRMWMGEAIWFVLIAPTYKN